MLDFLELAKQMLAPYLDELVRDRITALKGAFASEWIVQLREDMMTAFWDAIQRPGGAVARAPSEAVLGPNCEIVEIGFDVPSQDAKDQPWHRDFPSSPESYERHRMTSLAFNLTGVDVTSDMGPLEVAHGTQWLDGKQWPDQMFPPPELWPEFAQRAVR